MNFIKSKPKIIYITLGIFILIAIIILLRFTSRSKNPTPSTSKWSTYEESVSNQKITPVQKILEVNLNYDANTSPQMTVTGLTQKNGYPSNSGFNRTGGYTIQLIDTNRQVIYQQIFILPNGISYDEVNPDGTLHGGSEIRSQFSFTLTLPWFTNIAQIRVLNEKGIVILVSPFSNVQIIDNKPEFRTIKGDELLNNNPQNNINYNNSLIKSVNAQAVQGKTLNIALIGDKYTDMNAFHTDATKFSQELLSIEPFKSYACQIIFHTVDNTTSLGCGVNGRSDICNIPLVIQAINNAGVPHDVTDVIDNNTTFGGSTIGDIAVQYNGSYGADIFIHELGGHAVGRLLDEYTDAGGESSGIIDNAIHNLDGIGDGNCYSGNPPVAAWAGLVSATDYHIGCNNITNWYSSSQTSIMNKVDDKYFNPVSAEAIKRKLGPLTCNSTTSPTPIPSSTPAPIVTPQSDITPTISTNVPSAVCLGSCPVTSPTVTISPTDQASPTQSLSIPSPTQEISQIPSITSGATTQPTITGGGGGDLTGQGLIELILNFLRQLLELLLRLFGWG